MTGKRSTNKQVQCCDCLHHTCTCSCSDRQPCNGGCNIMKQLLKARPMRNCYDPRYCDYFELDTKLKDDVITILMGL